MAITAKLEFTKQQLNKFSQLFRSARLAKGMTQLEVARAAFDYSISHCKVSRVERCAMRHVDAYAIGQMAAVLDVPLSAIKKIDPRFKERWEVIAAASARGFWNHIAL